MANVVGASHETLDTLKEIGDALNNDANFAATVTRQLGEKLGKTENAASATKLQTARKIKVDGAVTGEVAFDGSGDVTLETNYKRVVVGNRSGSFNKETPYYKIGTMVVSNSQNGRNQNVLFRVTSFSGATGTLKVCARRAGSSNGTIIDVNGTFIKWETNDGIDTSCFYLAYSDSEDQTTSCFELWLKSVSNYDCYTVSIIEETDQQNTVAKNTKRWELNDDNTAYASITESYTIIESATAMIQKTCKVGFSKNEKVEDWLKVGSVTLGNSQRSSVTLRMDMTNSPDGYGTLRILTRRYTDASIASPCFLEWESCTNDIDPADYVLLYKDNGDKTTTFEFWLKNKQQYTAYKFTALSELSNCDKYWQLHNISTEPMIQELPEGYTIVTSRVLISKNIKNYVDEQLNALRQLLVTRGVLGEELTTIPELELS